MVSLSSMKNIENYSFVQSLAKSLLPEAWFAKIEFESRNWTYQCSNCGFARSVWDMGGIRYSAIPARKLAACSNCKKVGLANVSRKSEVDSK